MTHTSALPPAPPGKRPTAKTLFTDRPLPDKVIQYLDAWQPAYPPGTHYKYSNFSHVLAAEAAVQLGGMPYTRLLADDLTGPLGMHHTGMVCQHRGPGCAISRNPTGKEGKLPVGLWTSARDMGRFIQANLEILRDVPPKVARALALTHKELFRINPDHAVGAWEIKHHGNRLMLAKDGIDAGHYSWVAFEPNQQRGIALLRNGSKAKPNPATLGQQLLTELK